MPDNHFTTSIQVDQSPKAVFDAINNVRGWWSEEIDGNTIKLNDVFNYHFEDVHRCTMKITEMIPGKKVTWLVLDNYFNFTKDEHEWKGNEIIFDISQKDNKTILHFAQVGLVPSNECYDACRNGWTKYIQQSLYSLITTGKGQPNATGKPQTDNEKKLRTAR